MGLNTNSPDPACDDAVLLYFRLYQAARRVSRASEQIGTDPQARRLYRQLLAGFSPAEEVRLARLLQKVYLALS